MSERRSSSSEFLIRKMTEADVDKVSRLFAESFSEREPLSICLNETVESFLPSATSIVLNAVNQDLSFVCEDAGDIVGCCICEGFPVTPNEKFTGPVAELLQSCKKEWLEVHPELRDGDEVRSKVVCISVVAVKQSHQKLGIASKTICAALENAKDSGFQFAYVEASAAGTQHIFRNRFGFSQAFAKSYKDYTYNGEHIFSSITMPPEIQVFEKQLNE